MSTSPCSITTAELRYRQKADFSRKLIAANLQVLKAKHPDIYSKQLERLGGCHPNVTPDKLQKTDRLLIAARALEVLLDNNNAPSTAPNVLNNETEPTQTICSTHTAQTSIRNDLFFAQDPPSNPQTPKTSRSAYSSQPPIQSERELFAQEPHPNPSDSVRPSHPEWHAFHTEFALQTPELQY